MVLIKKVFQKLRNYIFAKTNLFKYMQRILQYKKVEGNYKYSVVSAVYNVDKYLEEYFQSITNQTLIFEKHIHLIMVDDGSTDNSANIIKKWQTKYPNNITYIKKENGGQSSARNLGMNHIKAPWVTFIDPDDFLDVRYFEKVDKFLQKNQNQNFAMIACNLIFYFDNKETFLNTHPLNYKFRKKESIFQTNNLDNHIHLATNTAFFKSKMIKEKQIKFDEKIKPNFEDAHFVNTFLLLESVSEQKSFVGFLRDAKYFYRKRADGSSTLDTSWQKRTLFFDVLKYGCLDLLKTSSKLYQGKIPLYIQRTILYHLIWYFKVIVNNSERIDFLTKNELENFKKLLNEIFFYIDIETIQNFDLAGISYYQKLGWLKNYKNYMAEDCIVYIEKYDKEKNQVLLKYFYYNESIELWNINKKEILPSFSKIRDYTFLDEVFILEKLVWLPLENNSILDATINSKKVIWSLNGKQYKETIHIEDIVNNFSNPTENYINRYIFSKFNNAWLFIDRDTQADDNAEHLYRYVKLNYPKKNIFFILRKDSHDWERLENEGFNLIAFTSFSHIISLFKSSYMISSHADAYVTDFIPRRFFKSILNFKFIFLQHGITMNDLSGWLNPKQINIFVTASKQEYESIVLDHTPYTYTKKEVVLTGFPRHDELMRNKHKEENTILIMPTWRQYLLGSVVGRGNKRAINKDFANTLYAKHWKSLLHSQELKDLVNKYNYKVIFFPHANIQPYISFFDLPKHIECLSHNQTTIQELFKKSIVMVTDYSSVAFEIAKLHREVLYYQFDYKEFFTNGHVFQKGYFDYKRDGFGSVCYKEKELIEELEQILNNNGEPRDKYLKRIENFFAFDDVNNCERVFNAIKNLE